MPARAKTWTGDWSARANTALASLNAYRREINRDINVRQRILREVQRTPSNVTPHIQQIIRAPLTGLR